MSKPSLSVIVPAFNEEARLGNTIERLVAFFGHCRRDVEVTSIVDDGSTDSTRQIAQDCAKRCGSLVHVIPNEENRGKGYSVRRGMLEARGLLSLLTDSDLSTPIEEFFKLEEKIVEENYDIAFGSRDIEGAEIVVHQPWFRENAGKVFNRFVRLLTPLPFRDTQCGFKLFRTAVARPIFERQRVGGYAFDVEVLFIARSKGLRLAEVPVRWQHTEGSKVRLFPDALFMAFDSARIRMYQLQGFYR